MTPTLQLEKKVARPLAPSAMDEPKLLVEWSARWPEFLSSIRPALARSDSRLAGEAPFGLVPYRILVPSYIVELFLILAVVAVQVKIEELRPYVAPRLTSHDIIYYSGDELPRTEDLGGAESGTSGRAGGDEAHHRTQTIKIARGRSLVSKVVDAPNLRLPASADAVANLLAVTPNPGPPPLEGMRSSRNTPRLVAPVIAPAPRVARDYTRNGIQLNSVIPPAPNVSRDPFMAAPNISASVIPPAPSVSDDHRLVAPALGPAVIPPAPRVSGERNSRAQSLNTQVIAPAPSTAADQSRSALSLNARVIPPAPGSVTRQLSASPLQTANLAVVPPPVSAPEQASNRNPRLAMPSASVVAPPPSADVSRDMRRLASGNTVDLSASVVPPPPSAQSGNGSFFSNLVGKIFGASDVVPPPPTVNPNSGRSTSLASNVVPPPPSVGNNSGGGNPHGARNGMGLAPGSNVIAPPPTGGVTGGTGTRPQSASASLHQGLPDVVPPPPSLSGPGGGNGNTGGAAGSGGGTLLANNVIPPPPSMAGGGGNAGSGTGRRGAGLGGPMEVGAPSASADGGGSGKGAGAVISADPGSKVGLPMSGGNGSLALSPSGGDKPGLGGTGSGTGIGHGNGPGSGINGEGSGAGKTGTGRGSDPNARGGISSTPGAGGAGNATSGNPRVPGVNVSGGNSVVTLPSFGSDPAGSAPPNDPSRTTMNRRSELEVSVVATAGSGGAFEPYKNLLHGDTVTNYIYNTALGTVVMESSDESSPAHSFGPNLSAPVSVRSDLPQGLPHARMVVTCFIDASGNPRNLHVLEAGPADMTAKVVAALRAWKFQPALRGNQPVEVKAIIGFNINTDDRF